MRMIVANAFIDKNTGEPYNKGDIFESTDEIRIKELKDGSYLATITNLTTEQVKVDIDATKNANESAKAETATAK